MAEYMIQVARRIAELRALETRLKKLRLLCRTARHTQNCTILRELAATAGPRRIARRRLIPQPWAESHAPAARRPACRARGVLRHSRPTLTRGKSPCCFLYDDTKPITTASAVAMKMTAILGGTSLMALGIVARVVRARHPIYLPSPERALAREPRTPLASKRVMQCISAWTRTRAAVGKPTRAFFRKGAEVRLLGAVWLTGACRANSFGARWQTTFAVVSCVLVLSQPAAGAKEARPKSTLNEPGTQLLHEVERLYGRKVSVVWTETRKGLLGKAQVARDGTPEVYIEPHIEDRATTLVHELFHLRDRFYGIPSRIRPAKLSPFRGHVTVRELEELFAMVRDRIAHTMFYCDMRAMGYGPTAAYTEALPQQIARFRETGVPRTRIRRTFMLLQAMLESDNQSLVNTLEREMARAGGAAEVAQAEELAQFIRQNPPKTGAEFINVFVAVINRILHEDGIKLEVLPTTWEQRGRLRDPVVVLRAMKF